MLAAQTLHIYLKYTSKIMQIKNIKIQLSTLAALYFTNINMVLTGIIAPVKVTEPSIISLFAIVVAVGFIVHKRKKK